METLAGYLGLSAMTLGATTLALGQGGVILLVGWSLLFAGFCAGIYSVSKG